MTTTTDTDVILSDTEIALLNDARTLLEHLAKRSARRSWNDAKTSADYGSVHALAEAAAHAIFTTLNWMSSTGVQVLTEDELHNRANRNIAEVQS